MGDKYKDEGEYLAGQLPRYGVRKIEYWGTALFSGEDVDEQTAFETGPAYAKGRIRRFYRPGPKAGTDHPLDIRPKANQVR